MKQGKTYVVGDVHGCDQELGMLLDRMSPREEDHIVFCGDLLDKGPDSVGVTQRVRELSKRVKVTLIKGNHEEKHERFRRHERRIRESGEGVNPIKEADQLRGISEGLSPEDITFLETARIIIHLPEFNATVVHGGIPKWVRTLPEDCTSRFLPRKWNEALRLRYVSKNGDFLSLDEINEDSIFWATQYDGRFGHVCFGHEPFMDGLGQFPHATGLDTGCCFGGALTAIELNTKEVLQVKALAKYTTRRLES